MRAKIHLFFSLACTLGVGMFFAAVLIKKDTLALLLMIFIMFAALGNLAMFLFENFYNQGLDEVGGKN